VQRAVRLLHLIAGVSYYKAAVPPQVVIEGDPIDADTAALLENVYRHGLGEFAIATGWTCTGAFVFPVPNRLLVSASGGEGRVRGTLRSQSSQVTPHPLGR